MTDNDIIKAFEEQINLIGSMRGVYLDDDGGQALYDAMDDARILINRQKAEIERLNNELHLKVEYIHEQRDVINEKKAEIERLSADRYLLKEDGTMTLLPRTDATKNRAEAIKEFAERLKVKGFADKETGEGIVCVEDIDNLVKEMVGERE